MISRWVSRSSIVLDMVQQDFSSNRLHSGTNNLNFEPIYADRSDDCWIGPAMVHFRQSA